MEAMPSGVGRELDAWLHREQAKAAAAGSGLGALSTGSGTHTTSDKASPRSKFSPTSPRLPNIRTNEGCVAPTSKAKSWGENAVCTTVTPGITLACKPFVQNAEPVTSPHRLYTAPAELRPSPHTLESLIYGGVGSKMPPIDPAFGTPTPKRARDFNRSAFRAQLARHREKLKLLQTSACSNHAPNSDNCNHVDVQMRAAPDMAPADHMCDNEGAAIVRSRSKDQEHHLLKTIRAEFYSRLINGPAVRGRHRSIRPRCSHGCACEVSSCADGPYKHGWMCNNCGKPSGPGWERWCCPRRHGEDFCFDCAPRSLGRPMCLPPAPADPRDETQAQFHRRRLLERAASHMEEWQTTKWSGPLSPEEEAAQIADEVRAAARRGATLVTGDASRAMHSFGAADTALLLPKSCRLNRAMPTRMDLPNDGAPAYGNCDHSMLTGKNGDETSELETFEGDGLSEAQLFKRAAEAAKDAEIAAANASKATEIAKTAMATVDMAREVELLVKAASNGEGMEPAATLNDGEERDQIPLLTLEMAETNARETSRAAAAAESAAAAAAARANAVAKAAATAKANREAEQRLQRGLAILKDLAATGKKQKHRGELTDARRSYDEVLAGRRRFLGDDDGETIDAMVDAAQVAWMIGDSSTAQELYAEVAARRRRTLGDEDTLTQEAIAAQAALYSHELAAVSHGLDKATQAVPGNYHGVSKTDSDELVIKKLLANHGFGEAGFFASELRKDIEYFVQINRETLQTTTGVKIGEWRHMDQVQRLQCIISAAAEHGMTGWHNKEDALEQEKRAAAIQAAKDIKSAQKHAIDAQH